MSLPKEPRQLMINLMYLVLTALLAMNVSKEVINAFNIVDNSIVQSNVNIDNKNKATMASFDDASNNPKLNPEKKAKVNTAKAIAAVARQKTKDILGDLQVYYDEIERRAGGRDAETGKIQKEDDLEAATSYMIEEEKGAEMRDKLQKYKEEMAKLVDDLPEGMKLSANGGSFITNLPLNLEKQPGSDANASWEFGMFNMVPAVAAITIIDKYKNDVQNSESAVLDELWASAMGEIKTKSLVFKKYGVIANADNHYVLPGQKINITAMLGAYNDGADGLKISIGGQNRTPKDGMASYQLTATGSGEKSVKVNAQYFDKNNNRWETVPSQTIKYYVGQPQATISLDKMKIFYKGLENPLTVSASGVPLNDLTVTAGPNLRLIKKGAGKYHALASANSGKTWVQITGKRSDGSIENFGKIEYRLGRVPDPVAYVADKTGGPIPVNALKLQQAVFAKLKGFPYELPFDVVSFTLVHVPKKGEMPAPLPVRGKFLRHSSASASVRGMMQSLRVGDRLFIEDIRAVGPDKEVRKLGGISFTMPN